MIPGVENLKRAWREFSTRNVPRGNTLEAAFFRRGMSVDKAAEKICREFEKQYPGSHVILDEQGVKRFITSVGEGKTFPVEFRPTLTETGVIDLDDEQREIYRGLSKTGFLSIEQFKYLDDRLAWIAT